MIMDDYQFVTLTHPLALKERKNQGLIRAHAIRNTAQKARRAAAKKNENFREVAIDTVTRRPVTKKFKERIHHNCSFSKGPSVGSFDPFDTLPMPGCSNRLRQLIAHRTSWLHSISIERKDTSGSIC
jgi:hypothetical protein